MSEQKSEELSKEEYYKFLKCIRCFCYGLIKAEENIMLCGRMGADRKLNANLWDMGLKL